MAMGMVPVLVLALVATVATARRGRDRLRAETGWSLAPPRTFPGPTLEAGTLRGREGEGNTERERRALGAKEGQASQGRSTSELGVVRVRVRVISLLAPRRRGCTDALVDGCSSWASRREIPLSACCFRNLSRNNTCKNTQTTARLAYKYPTAVKTQPCQLHASSNVAA